MNNIVIITSIIEPPNIPFNYIDIRSVFTKEERYLQLKKTIESIREKIPLCCIILVECSPKFDDKQLKYINDNVEHFLNIYDDDGNKKLIEEIYSKTKAMGEGVMTIYALEFLFNSGIQFNNLFKISGRYWLNNDFRYELYNNENNVIHKINGANNNYFTCFYKLNSYSANLWLYYLKENKYNIEACGIGYENVFAIFMNENCIFETINKVGINGYVSVCGQYIDI